MGVLFYMLQCDKDIYLGKEDTAELNLGESSHSTESL